VCGILSAQALRSLKLSNTHLPAAAAAENARSARVTDALLNWETVKYFTNESLEQQKYGEAIDQYQVIRVLTNFVWF
jgi:ABC-type transport system involved in Fe-S cluster assembly fused permease/ATPase subunit